MTSAAKLRFRIASPFSMPLAAVLWSGFLGLPGLAAAGPNQGGTLIVHAVPEYTGTLLDVCDEPPIVDCAEANSSIPQSEEYALFWILAAFGDGITPQLSGVRFGIEYDPSLFNYSDYGHCGDSESTWGGWPMTRGDTTVSFDTPRTESIVPVYWFLGYADEGPPTTFDLVQHLEGAAFLDDSVPPVADEILGLGALGFNGAPGFVPCLQNASVGACCVPSGACLLRSSTDCDALMGVWFGALHPCDPDPCSDVVGACCGEAECLVVSAADCAFRNWEFQGYGTTCESTGCFLMPEGACCLPGDGCAIERWDDCDELGGSFQGDGVPCPADCVMPPIPCCISEVCVVLSEEDCADQGGTPSPFDTGCNGTPCAPGAGGCCIGDACVILTEDLCSSSGGDFLGEGADCTGGCLGGEHGGCCYDGRCRVLSWEACAFLGGAWIGDTPCTETACHGACCVADGSCYILAHETCTLSGGEFFGDASVCEPHFCEPPDGACCLPTDTCMIATEEECERFGYSWVAAGVSCDDAPCQESSDVTDEIASPGERWLGEPIPNPASESVRLTLDLPVSARVIVSLISVSGRLEEIIFDGEMPAGARQVEWSVRTDLASGRYFLRMDANGRVETRSLLLQR